MSRRRLLLVALGFAALGARPSIGQGKKRLPKIGVLFTGSATSVATSYETLLIGLKDYGLIDGKTAIVVTRYSEGSTDRLKVHAAELARANVDVVVTSSSTATETARHALRNVPLFA